MASVQQIIEENEMSTEVAPVDTLIETTESHNSSIEKVEIDFVAKLKEKIFTLWRKIVGIRKPNEENTTQNHRADQIKRVRLHHVWPGKNVRMLLLFVFDVKNLLVLNVA